MAWSAPLSETERWFVRRGLPHLIPDYEARTDIWTRATPLLVPAYLLGGLNALDLGGWSTARNLLTAVVVVAVLVATWAVTNRVRRRPLLAWPREIGVPELAAFVVGPALPSLLFAQWGDAVQSAAEAVAVLAAVYLATSYAVVPLLRWAGRHVAEQVNVLGALVGRALPLLLLFITFLFINAEVWQVSGTLHGPAYPATLATFALLGGGFILSRSSALPGALVGFDSWDDVAALLPGTPAETVAVPSNVVFALPALTRRQRFNVALVSLFSQGLQIVSVALAVFAFFVGFGFLAVSEATAAAWTGSDAHVLASWSLDARQLVLTEELLRVAGFLAAFTGMYVAVLASTDATYKEQFTDEVSPEIRRAVAVHCALLAARTTSDR
jgi:hypothetical protein